MLPRSSLKCVSLIANCSNFFIVGEVTGWAMVSNKTRICHGGNGYFFIVPASKTYLIDCFAAKLADLFMRFIFIIFAPGTLKDVSNTIRVKNGGFFNITADITT